MSRTFYTTPAIEKILLLDTDTQESENILQMVDTARTNDAIVSTMYVATESITFTEWLHDVKVILNRLGNRAFKLGRTIVESITRYYPIIITLWDKKINKHIDDIDDHHFNNVVLPMVPYEILKKRIAIIGEIANVLQKIESVVNEPIDDVDDPNSYNTPEFVRLYKELTDIGFTMTNRTFVSAKTRGYRSVVEKRTLQAHGYNKSDLPEILELAKSISRIGTNAWVKETVGKFVEFNRILMYKEEKVSENKALNDEDRDHEIKILRIKISRLWWLSNYIHMLHMLTTDQLGFILKIFRAADDSIPLAVNPDDDGPGSKFF